MLHKACKCKPFLFHDQFHIHIAFCKV